MSKMTLKLATDKVITALTAKLATTKSDYATYEKNEEAYAQARDKWNKDIIAYAVANISKAENFRTSYRSYNKSMNIDFDVETGENFPKEPERDYPTYGSHSYTETIEDIENALRMLNMTDEPYVNASTMRSISKYL